MGLIQTGKVATLLLELAFCAAIVVLMARARTGCKVPGLRRAAGRKELPLAITFVSGIIVILANFLAPGYMVMANWFNWIQPNLVAIGDGCYLLIVPFLIGL